jgi:hypothetical protein
MSAVYVDDLILTAVQDVQGSLLTKTVWATLHAIHSIFPAPTTADALGTKYPILEKKLNQRDAWWDTLVKEVLGYKLNREDHTLQIPAQ